MAVEDVPQWVDKVYSAEMLTQFYDYYGTLKHGWLNSVLGQKDCLKPRTDTIIWRLMMISGCTRELHL